MRVTIQGYHDRDWLMQVRRWAKRLEAEDMEVEADGGITLTCKDGYICEHYHPSRDELMRKEVKE